jgi:hypothetical protein
MAGQRVSVVFIVALALCAAPGAEAQTALAQLQFDIIGMRLVVDPPALTVPKNIASRIDTSLVLPEGAGPEAQEAFRALTSGAVVEAELRGPSISPILIRVAPGEPIPIPALQVPGQYFLEHVRLVKDGQTLLDATSPAGDPASIVPIQVIGDILVTSVSSRPLTLDEIRGKGIVVDERNFQAFNFEVAFNIDGTPFKIALPIAVPTREFEAFMPEPAARARAVAQINRELLDRAVVELPPQFDRPGLNFSIAPLPFLEVNDESSPRGFGPPPITGLVIIPGNVAFLNQFFSVMLMVTNVAPDGTPLVVTDVKARIELPAELRLANVNGAGPQPTVPVRYPGPDGEPGTADDRDSIGPQESGKGEFVVEGLLEGSHTFDIAIDATLLGLPQGAVKLTGMTAGAVFVRHPTFSITLSHPRTIARGESYDLYATVTNTSSTVANLVTVNLNKLSITGAELLSDESVTFDTLAPGDSATARFRLVAQETGQVTFASFHAGPGLSGRIQLRTGVGERDVPISPNAIVLPRTTDYLPPALVAAAQRVLGQAFSVATAPPGGLPPDVTYVTRAAVIARGLELGEAGQRVKFGESLVTVAHDLVLDWFANRDPDDGFDQLLRQTEAGRALRGQFARILGDAAASTSVLAMQRRWAQTTVAREPHISAAIASGGGPAPVMLTIEDAAGLSVGESEGGVQHTLPWGALLRLEETGHTRSDLALVSRIASSIYTVSVLGTGSGTFDLGIVVPAGDGQLTQLRYEGVAIHAGGLGHVAIDLASPGAATLVLDADGDGVDDEPIMPVRDVIDEDDPHVITVTQLESSYFDTPGDFRDPTTYGLLVGVLFDKPVTEASAEDPSHYGIENNRIIGAQLQRSGRLVFLYLEKPIGALVARDLEIHDVVDGRGVPIEAAAHAVTMIYSNGGHVFGQVRTADGQPVPHALLSATIVFGGNSAFTIAHFRTDAQGSYDIDFVLRAGMHLQLTAQHPVTAQFTQLRGVIRGAGEALLLNPTFLGRGTARGRVLAADGVTPIAEAVVGLSPSNFATTAVTDFRERGWRTNPNAQGEYVFTDVPVGTYVVWAYDATGAVGRASGLVSTAGGEAVADIVLSHSVAQTGMLVGRVFASDGATPLQGVTVYAGSYDDRNRSRPTVEVHAETRTDDTGSFAFGPLATQGYDVVAIDAAGNVGVSRRVTVSAGLTTSTSVVMEATGAVEGVVYNAQNKPVPGAVIAGGIALGTANEFGFFRIEGVPAGRRTIEAGDPVTKRRGSSEVTVLPGQTVRVDIALEARATIIGQVLDADGHFVPKATVRIPQGEGFIFVFANDNGFFRFPDLPLGEYLLQAPGPPQEALIEGMIRRGIDPRTAFTAGDVPPELGGPIEGHAGDANAVLAAYQRQVQALVTGTDDLLTTLPRAEGSFGWNKVILQQDSTTVPADIEYLELGSVSGTTVDSNGAATGALVRVTGLTVAANGGARFDELARVNSDPVLGTFSFSRIPRFDLEMFQATNIRAGDFTLQAAHPFLPTVAELRGQLTDNNPDRTGLVLQFPSLNVNGTISGTVFMPDGVTPAEGARVAISLANLAVITDAQGRFTSPQPIPPLAYMLTVEHPPTGLRAQMQVGVRSGQNVDVHIRLLGLGDATVTVRRPDGSAVEKALVTIRRRTFPGDQRTGMTDQNGRVRLLTLTEGLFDVLADEQLTGLTGRGSGSIAVGADAPVSITITGSGTVTGTFIAADQNTRIANAQVVLQTSAGVKAYASTDRNGRFLLTAIPIGSFTVEASDPVTARLGRTTGELKFQGDTLDVTVVTQGRGTVEGFALGPDELTPLTDATVQIQTGGFLPFTLLIAPRPDGSFRFDGIPVGTFTLFVHDRVSDFNGIATGEVTFEGEVVTQNVWLDKYGALHVQVVDPDGLAVGNAGIELSGSVAVGRPTTATTDANGEFTFEFLPLGEYTITARSLADEHNGGRVKATLTEPDRTVDAIVPLHGTGTVVVTVRAADQSTVPSARVTVLAHASAFGDRFVGFTDSSGQVTLPGIPVGELHVRAEIAALGGLSTSAVTMAGETRPVTVELSPSGSVAGRILLPTVMTPAAGAIVTLDFISRSALQDGVVQVVTGIDGRFEFTGIPVGPFTLAALEPITDGVRVESRSIDQEGQLVDLLDLVLDNASPRVVTIAPADGAVGVSSTGPVVIEFDEPISRSTAVFTINAPQANVLVTNGTAAVAGAWAFSNGDRTLTFTPFTPLASGQPYSVVLKGAPVGVRDAHNLPLLDPVVSRFVVRDTIPPAVMSLNPRANATLVTPNASIRVEFSEAIRPQVTIAVTDGAGRPVPGSTSLAVGGSVAVFAPAAFLSANTTYSVVVTSVIDLFGNPLAAGRVEWTFATIDTEGPTITKLDVSGPPRLVAGSQVTLRPILADADVRRVEYRFGAAAPQIVSAAPFAASVTLPAGVTALQVSVVAFDALGNRSTTFTHAIDIAADEPPSLTLATVDGVTVIGQGENVGFDITAIDDTGLTSLLFSIVGAVTETRTIPIASAPQKFSTVQQLVVPATAISNGVMTVQAAAIDLAGGRSNPVNVAILVRDANAPSASIVTPVSDARALPGQPLDVVISAADDVSLASIALQCAPALSGCQSRPVPGGAATSTQTFTVQVPANAQPGSLQLTASATDTAGNTRTFARSVRIVDAVAPAVTSLHLLTGAVELAPGARATLEAVGSDNLAVTAFEFSIPGFVSPPVMVAVTPPASPARSSTTFQVPASTPDGTVITASAVAIDAEGNRSGTQTLTLTVRAGAPSNTPPVADAGPDQSDVVGTTIQLDGSASRDLDGDAITWAWTFASRPAGSTATFDDPASETPTFRLDRPGAYIVELIVRDGTASSAPDTVTITTVNSRPVANAGPDRTASVGDHVMLDGSGSTDIDSDQLAYSWSFVTRPPGSTAALDDVTTVQPSFDLDVPGAYVLQLVVHDGRVQSLPDRVTISTQNSPPVADAGPDQTVAVGALVRLDGSGSNDVDGNQVSFAWTLIEVPQGSAAALIGPATVNPTLVADTAGTYVVRLIVADGQASSEPDTVTITTGNSRPVANAGADQTVESGATVQLSGEASTDVDGNDLTFSWSIVTAPAGSQASLSDPTIVNPTFTADQRGTYIVQLVVGDGTSNSVPDTVTITTRNSRPIANAGADRTVGVGALVALDATGSTDPDNDSLTYQWSMVGRPPGSTASLAGETAFSTSFITDVAGTFVVQLIVHDGLLASTPDTVSITTGNVAPVADAGPDRTVALGATVTLDGGGSRDGNQDPLSFQWSLVSRPAGSAAVLSNAGVAQPTFVADRFGTYVAQLIVSDGTLASAPDTVAISITPGTISLSLPGNTVGVGRAEPLTITVSPATPQALALSVTSSDSGVVAVESPGSVSIPAGGNTAQITVTGVAAGSVSIHATAPNYAEGVISIGGTPNLISAPAALVVPPGQDVTLPITIAPSPAPAGGLQVAIASSDPSRVTVVTPTITVAAGAVAGNATIRGSGIGTATVSASAQGYATARTVVTTAASLNIVENSVTVNPVFTQPITVRLESAGVPVGAPASGVVVTITSSASACAVATSPITIAGGLTSAAATVSYGGTATLPCTATLTARATDIDSDTIQATVNPAPGIAQSHLPTTVGAGLQRGPLTVSVGSSQHSGVTLRLRSSNPAVLRVAPNATTAGTEFIDVPLAAGVTSTTYYAQGLASATLPTTATITATATGFTENVGTVTIVQPGIMLSGVPVTTTGLSANSVFRVFLGIRNGTGSTLLDFQAVRAGGSPVTVTVSNSDASAAQLVAPGGTVGQTVTATLAPGEDSTPSSGAPALAFDPLGGGATTVSVSAPGFAATTAASQLVTISAPAITQSHLPTTVGAGLQRGPLTVSLGAPQHGGVTLRLRSSNAAVLRVAPDAATAGAEFIDVPLANGTTSTTFYAQGLAGAPLPATATITATAAGFTENVSTVTIVQPGLMLSGVPATTTSLSTNSVFRVFVGIRNNTGSTLLDFQAVRAGGPPLTVTVGNSDASVAQLAAPGGSAGQTVTATLMPGDDSTPNSGASALAFDPLGAGSTTVSVTAPGLAATTAASQLVTVSAPGITQSHLPTTVGAELQRGPLTVTLGAGQHGGVTLRLRSSNPAVLRVAPNATTAGAEFIDVPLANGTASTTYYVQGVAGAPLPATATITATATGFTENVGPVTIVQPGVMLSSVPASTTSLSANSVFRVFLGIRNGTGSTLLDFQAVRMGGSPVTVTVSNSDASVAQLVASGGVGQTVTTTLSPGEDSTPNSGANALAFDPLGAGSTTVSVTAPGFASTTAASQLVTVSAPGISQSHLPTTVGAGLQRGPLTVSLGAGQHGGVTLRLRSSNPAVLRVAPNATTAGAEFIDVPLANGATTTTFYVQGLAGAPLPATATITATATGFTENVSTVTIVQPGIMLSGVPAATTASSTNSVFRVFLGIRNGTGSTLLDFQAVRAGGSPVTVTVGNSDASVAQLAAPGSVGQSVTATLAPGEDSTPGSAASGLAFDPLAAGSTTVSATAPGFAATTAATATVQVNP